MNQRRYPKTIFIVSTTLLAIFAAGCDGCSLSPLSSSSSSLTLDDLSGKWHVSAYGADDDGCEPYPTDAPIERLEVAVGESPDDRDASRLELLICPSDDHCFDKAIPENQLEWDDDLEQGSITHHTASLHRSDPLDTTCRLRAQQTILIPDSNVIELTRSHYEIDIPTEGEESCTSELAEEYHSHMPCVRGESYQLRRAETQPAS